MVNLIRRVSKKAGLPPGTPVHVGEKKVEEVRITIIDYDKDSLEIREAVTVEECFAYKDKPSVTWINITGLHEVSNIEKLGTHYSLHSLVLEDILNTEQRPKMDVFDDQVFIVLKIQTYNNKTRMIEVEQISIVLGKNHVITFQERESIIVETIRKRIRSNLGRVRKASADYLSYTIIDAIVDSYFKVLEGIGEEIEIIEDEVVRSPDAMTMQKIHFLRKEIIFLRKSVWPLREIINRLDRDESSLFKKTTKIYLKDLYDHTIQVIETVETYRDIISGMLDLYLSTINNKMNEIMKILTVFASIFIPLTFITGIYGMNFNPEKSPLNMPELNWYLGYPFALGLMSAISIAIIIYFKRKKWL